MYTKNNYFCTPLKTVLKYVNICKYISNSDSNSHIYRYLQCQLSETQFHLNKD